MGWEGYHLHQFVAGGMCFGAGDEEMSRFTIPYERVTLEQIARQDTDFEPPEETEKADPPLFFFEPGPQVSEEHQPEKNNHIYQSGMFHVYFAGGLGRQYRLL